MPVCHTSFLGDSEGSRPHGGSCYDLNKLVLQVGLDSPSLLINESDR